MELISLEIPSLMKLKNTASYGAGAGISPVLMTTGYGENKPGNDFNCEMINQWDEGSFFIESKRAPKI